MENNVDTIAPKFNLLDKLKVKWNQYNNFELSEILKLIKAKILGYIVMHCAYCMIAQKLIKKPIRTVIDVGACNGKYAKGAKYILPKSTVYAFEPTEICNQIKGKDIYAFNFALWNKTNRGVFYKTINSKTNMPCPDSSFFNNDITERYHKKYNEEVKKIIINRKRFDELDIKIERPCFVKIDVEGAEFEVLKGFGNRLNEVDIIQLEYLFEEPYKRHNFDKIVLLLDKYNFRFFQPMISWYKNMPLSNDLIFFRTK